MVISPLICETFIGYIIRSSEQEENMPTIDSIAFDTATWSLVDRSSEIIRWRNSVGDGLSLNFFSIRPDIPLDLSDAKGLEQFYQENVQRANGQIVEFHIGSLSGIPTIRTIFKFPQQPHGMFYVASLTLPFEQFSYVIKTQCHEHGTTGIRESVVMSQLFGEGKFDLAELPKISEDEKYDPMFPEHPLSRSRAYLKTIIQTLNLTPEIQQSPPF